jgi:hypothetical protein
MKNSADWNRFFGPVSDVMSLEISETLLNDSKFQEALKQLLSGEIDPRQFAYETQVLAEGIEEELRNGGPDGLDEYKVAREQRMGA